MFRRLLIAAVLSAALAGAGRADVRSAMDPRLAPKPTEAACRSRVLAATGGPRLQDPKLLVVRWLGFSIDQPCSQPRQTVARDDPPLEAPRP